MNFSCGDFKDVNITTKNRFSVFVVKTIKNFAVSVQLWHYRSQAHHDIFKGTNDIKESLVFKSILLCSQRNLSQWLQSYATVSVVMEMSVCIHGNHTHSFISPCHSFLWVHLAIQCVGHVTHSSTGHRVCLTNTGYVSDISRVCCVTVGMVGLCLNMDAWRTIRHHLVQAGRSVAAYRKL